MTNIIAFAGTKQSGKTTCANDVSEFFTRTTIARKVKIYNFADPLKKDICINILGLTEDQCYGNDMDKNTPTDIIWDGKYLTAREVMQFVGTDLFRKMKNNVWADATIIKIKNEKPSLAIIADCRFPNEVQAVQQAGGIVIRLTRKPFDSDHPSETALEKNNYDWNNFDIILDNKNLTTDEQKKILIPLLQQKGILPL
jgi:hypothetical protein